jgi:hypothetical protein
MTGDWYLSSEDLGERTPVRAAMVGRMVTGCVELTGVVTHAPRTVEFWYAPAALTYDDRWRITIGGRLLWLATPLGHAVDSGDGLRWTDRSDDVEPFPRPAPEVVSLASLDRAVSRLGSAARPEPSGVLYVAGRGCRAYETAGARRARLVVDEETGFVLKVDADGSRGPHQITVRDFAVVPLEPEVFQL